MLWDIPYKSLPHHETYRRRNAVAVWIGAAVFALAWAGFDASRDVLWAIALATVWIGSYYAGCATVQNQWDATQSLRLEREVLDPFDKRIGRGPSLSAHTLSLIKAHPGTDYDTAREKVMEAVREERMEVVRRFWEGEDALRSEAMSNLY